MRHRLLDWVGSQAIYRMMLVDDLMRERYKPPVLFMPLSLLFSASSFFSCVFCACSPHQRSRRASNTTLTRLDKTHDSVKHRLPVDLKPASFFEALDHVSLGIIVELLYSRQNSSVPRWHLNVNRGC